MTATVTEISTMLSILLIVCATSALDDPPLFELFSEVEKENFVTRLIEPQLIKAPKWRKDDPNPPVAVRRGIALAEQVVGKHAPQDPKLKWELFKIELKQIRKPGDDFWIYSVHFVRETDRRIDSYRLIILMDETVIVPVKKE